MHSRIVTAVKMQQKVKGDEGQASGMRHVLPYHASHALPASRSVVTLLLYSATLENHILPLSRMAAVTQQRVRGRPARKYLILDF